MIRPLLPKASASYCFQICKKIAQLFKIIAIGYFYFFIIIFNFTLQEVLLVIELKEVGNCCQQMSDFSIPFAIEKIYQKFVMKRGHTTMYNHLHLLLAYYIFFQENFMDWKHSITIFWRHTRKAGSRTLGIYRWDPRTWYPGSQMQKSLGWTWNLGPAKWDLGSVIHY